MKSTLLKRLSIILVLALLVAAFAGCAPSEEPDTTGAPTEKPSEGTSEEASEEPDGTLTLETVKVGFIHHTDPSDQGYVMTLNQGAEKMQADLGLRDDQVITKFNIPESSDAEAAALELVEQGCNIIFATSFGHEQYLLNVAKDHPEVEFAHATGYQAAGSGLANMHNFFSDFYQARYLSGIAAGLKTETNKLGYVAAQPFAECISGYCGFYLGALSVNPDVTMEVKYTYSWNDPVTETQAAVALIQSGCDILGHHTASASVATAAQQNGVYHVGYTTDMRDVAPDASLTSAVFDWSIPFKSMVEQVVAGEAIPADWTGGLAEGACDISPLNEDIIAPGTKEAIEEARDKIVNTDWDVFTGPLYNNEGELVVAEGETFIEPKSAPSWEHILQGITVTE
ncbi:MAG: BMP family ABC transporter substrate-binding protein [Eubacteriales bacterium]|nr:BMP family ABC transporter substrate-binding protein [Eubacteriales bacterium]